jgi:hypothetical protein
MGRGLGRDPEKPMGIGQNQWGQVREANGDRSEKPMGTGQKPMGTGQKPMGTGQNQWGQVRIGARRVRGRKKRADRLSSKGIGRGAKVGAGRGRISPDLRDKAIPDFLAVGFVSR